MTEPEPDRKQVHSRWTFPWFKHHYTRLTDCEEATRKGQTVNRVFCYIRRLVDAYGTHQCGLMACACAYCALLSLVPLLVVGIAALGFFMGGSQRALNQVENAIRAYVPRDPEILQSVNDILKHILADRALIGVIGMVGLLYGAHQAFLALQPAMNIIWGVAETRHWLKQRLIALLLAFYAIALMGANLAGVGFFAYLNQYYIPFVPGRVEAGLSSFLLGLLPMLILAILFATLYRVLPSYTVPWRAAFLGAGVAALFWQLTLFGFGIYLAHYHSYNRLYGPLGGLVILVVWAYYSMSILLLGAEIAADFATRRYGIRAAEARAHSGADLTVATGKNRMPPPAELS
jgi:membrane protein